MSPAEPGTAPTEGMPKLPGVTRSRHGAARDKSHCAGRQPQARVNLSAQACEAARDLSGRGSRCLFKLWMGAQGPAHAVVSGLPRACRA
jgi:hypothetical protein